MEVKNEKPEEGAGRWLWYLRQIVAFPIGLLLSITIPGAVAGAIAIAAGVLLAVLASVLIGIALIAIMAAIPVSLMFIVLNIAGAELTSDNGGDENDDTNENPERSLH